MRVHDLMSVLGVAAATAVFTLVLLGPWNVGASDEAAGIKPTILQPEFTSNGCVFTLKTDKPEYAAGETPVLEIQADNPSDKAVTATVWLSIMAADVPSPFARRMAFPQPIWSKPFAVDLKPGETTTTEITADIQLPANQNIMVTLGDAEQTLMATELPVLDGSPATDTTTQAPVSQSAPAVDK